MIQPDRFDDGWLDTLSKGDEERFRSQYRKVHSQIESDRVEARVESQIDEQARPEFKLTRTVVEAFHPDGRADIDNGDFEFAFTNPLHNLSGPDADALLARPDYHGKVHLCFVLCEIGGEDQISWAENAKKVREFFDTPSTRRVVKSRLEAESKQIGSVQFVTLTRSRDTTMLDISDLQRYTEADNYAIWTVDEDTNLVSHCAGKIAHEDLRDAMSTGFDYDKVGAITIKYSLTSHPILALEELVFQIIRDHERHDDDHPQEFDRSEISTRFDNGLEIGLQGDEREEAVREVVQDLLQTGIDIEIFFDNDGMGDSDRDYYIRFSGEKPTSAKEAVENKFIKNQTPIEHGRMAYQQTRDDFDRRDSSFEDFK